MSLSAEVVVVVGLSPISGRTVTVRAVPTSRCDNWSPNADSNGTTMTLTLVVSLRGVLLLVFFWGVVARGEGVVAVGVDVVERKEKGVDGVEGVR